MGLDITPDEAETLTGIIREVSSLMPPAAPFELYALTMIKAIGREPELRALCDRVVLEYGNDSIALALFGTVTVQRALAVEH
jgi:hypothetical protein